MPAQQLSILCAALLFDLDGVLTDSTACAENVWLWWAKERGIDAELVLKTIHGRRSVESVAMMAPQLDAQVEADIVTDREVLERDGIHPMPGARELLLSLPQHRWTVVTSCPERLARVRLEAAGLPIPQLLVTSERVRFGKPKPDPYLAGAKMLGADPEYCVVVEDAPIGIQSAKAAGMRVIGLRTTYAEQQVLEAGADLIVDNCSDLRVTTSGKSLQVHLR